MGKRLKKARAPQPQKDKRIAAATPKRVPQPSNPGDDVVLVAKERKPCPHIDKGLDFDQFSAKIVSSELVECEACRESASDRKGSKGKGKHGKRKGSTSTESKAIWVCLKCGHYSCGGVGLPTTPQCHAGRHARQTHHVLVMQFENPQLRWCFACNMLIAIDKMEENGEEKDIFSDFVKLIKGHSSNESSANVEDVWFGSGSVISGTKSTFSTLSDLNARGGYMARGLVNLGNTCFFNSVLQNLLAIDRLRGYFLDLDASAGLLTISLKKLVTETISEAGLKNVINPRSAFSSICSKAPQFSGYQQQDSHELLRFLLDGLCTEELSMRKRISSSKQSWKSLDAVPTFVDATFGGQISSTVHCVECGHSSTVYESFLDLSLSVPTKRTPPKTAQPISRAKKTKLQPKRIGKVRTNVNKDKSSVLSSSVATPSTPSELANPPQSSSGDPNTAEQGHVGMKSLSAVQESENELILEVVAEQTSTLLDNSAWLDYLDMGNVPDDNVMNSKNNEKSIIQDSENKNTTLSDVPLQSGSESSNSVPIPSREPNVKPDCSSVNTWEEEVPQQVQGSEVLLLPYKEESYITGGIMTEDEASSSIVCGQNDFDGFADLFNEPEVVAGPAPRPFVGEEGTSTGYVASESDPDEVDDTVSLEKCLAQFIKPERLANENAWDCENCSKILQHQRLRAKKQVTADNLVNGCETRAESESLSSNMGPCPADVRNLSNGNLVLGDGINSIENGGSEMSTSVKCQQQAIDRCDDEPKSAGCSSDNIPDASSGILDGNQDAEESEDEEIKSKRIKVKRDATKRFLIKRPPPILTIHLKRFSQDARGRLSKLNGHVGFSEKIDLRPYMDSRFANAEKYEYSLIGVVQHSGTMRGGHYTAYVRGGEQSRGKAEKENTGHVWYHASDAQVSQVTLDKVLRSDAYILFYEQC